MQSYNMLYIIGLVLVLLYFFIGVDDFIWDVVTLIRRSKYSNQLLNLQELDLLPPKRLAVAIAAWHEDNVLGAVIDNVIASTHYPKSMYHIFLGIYPNDTATLDVAKKLETKYDNVHIIINCLPGPTSKAQNINYVITQIKEFEKEHQWQFASLTVHDSEDVVHPYELKVTNYLLEKHQALQFPVFPLLEMPRFSNFFKNITTSTYADEFAENHFTTMVSRYNVGAFVPSAGTGFTLSRETLEIFGDEDVLPKESLTEDYRLALTLFEKNIRMYYVLERVPRVLNNNKLVNEFIATRSMFPNTFKMAIKQKTRWILGITMQSFNFKDIFKTKGLKFAGRYSLYKDLKAKIGNLLAIVGYPVLIYFMISFFIELEPIYPKYTFSWYLSLVVTGMMIERQVFRAVSIYNVYGMRSVFFACLLPPLVPIRFVWGNIINMVATINAYKQKIFGNQTPAKKEKKLKRLADKELKNKQQASKKITWDKTEHDFLEEHILKRFHRNLGDVLLEKNYISADVLREALPKAKKSKITLGGYLLKNSSLTEEQLLDALSNIKNIQYIDIATLREYQIWKLASDFDEELLRSLQTIPILKTKTGYVFMFCNDSPIDAQTTLRETYNITIKAVFGTEKVIEEGLSIMYKKTANKINIKSILDELYKKEIIGYEELIIARSYKILNNLTEYEVLSNMGIIPKLVI